MMGSTEDSPVLEACTLVAVERRPGFADVIMVLELVLLLLALFPLGGSGKSSQSACFPQDATGAAPEAVALSRDVGSEPASKSFGNVENVWVFLADIRDWEAVKAVLEEVLGNDMPVPTVVGTSLMGRSGVEIQMVAGG
jgi:hypothetical protein